MVVAIGASPVRTNRAYFQALLEAGATGLEPATSGVTGRRSNQLSYAPSEARTLDGESKYGKTAFVRSAATLEGLRSLIGRIELPEDAPNPAVGALGKSDGDPGSGSPSSLTRRPLEP